MRFKPTWQELPGKPFAAYVGVLRADDAPASDVLTEWHPTTSQHLDLPFCTVWVHGQAPRSNAFLLLGEDLCCFAVAHSRWFDNTPHDGVKIG